VVDLGELPSTVWDQLDTNLTLDLVVGIQDPLRPGAAAAVATCQKAGVTVRMCTGDNATTAVAIAKQCGILPNPSPSLSRSSSSSSMSSVPSNQILTGPEFRNKFSTAIARLNDTNKRDGGGDSAGGRNNNQEEAEAEAAVTEEVKESELLAIKVLARSTPSDKRHFVELLMACGEVVGVTGDGANDAPALKAAHVGLAMNLSGTAVAKAASDVIIMDDDFASIVSTV
jgi:magnesium-transporting ATPase (P-type)